MIIDRQKMCVRLRKARKDAKLKQEHVARYLEIPVSAVSAMEAGSRKLEAVELFMLSRLYNKPLDWFFREESDDEAPAGQNRWYDSDPVVMECIGLMQKAPPHLQRSAAYGVIGFLSER